MTEHPVFGKLKYKPDDEHWIGFAKLPLFAAVGARPDPEPLSPEEEAAQVEDMTAKLQEAQKGIQQLMSQKFGDAGDKLMEVFGKEALAAMEGGDEDEAPDPREEAREKKRQEREQKAKDRLAKGKFPFRLADADESGPTPQQEASFRFLADNEGVILADVRDQAFASFQYGYSQEYWRQFANLKPAATVDALKDRFAVTEVEFSREHRGGFAHVVFHLSADWEDDHGLMVVFSPDTLAVEWTTHDGLYDLIGEGDESESGDGGDDEPDPAAERQEELAQAIHEGNAAEAKRLIAAGASVDPVDDEDYALLHMAVDECELEQVKLLLALGADPNVTEDITDGKPRTPLFKCKQLARTMGLAPKKKKKKSKGEADQLMEEAFDDIMGQAMASPQMAEMGQRLLEIIRLLEEAGGKVKLDE